MTIIKNSEISADEKLSHPRKVIRVYDYGHLAGEEKLYAIGTERNLFETKTGKKLILMRFYQKNLLLMVGVLKE